MVIKKSFSKEEIQRCIDGNGWDFGNSILYEMCKKNPYHQSAEVVVGKIWLIGRSYAAAIERRQNADSTDSGDDFYFNIVAPKMLEIGKELDERIDSLSRYQCIIEDNLKEVVETHFFLTETFSVISGLNKRSLASKYLHFHVPRMFYIYDSRAIQGARKYVNYDKILRTHLEPYGDKDYIELVTRLFALERYVEKEFDLKVTPRTLDSFLLKY